MSALHPTEDPQREPDGIPHLVIGLTAVFSLLLAMSLVVIFSAGTATSVVLAILLAFTAIPVLIFGLKRVATRDRDQAHPSR